MSPTGQATSKTTPKSATEDGGLGCDQWMDRMDHPTIDMRIDVKIDVSFKTDVLRPPVLGVSDMLPFLVNP